MKRTLRVLISAGPTREPIDPVRFISNRSTGYLGAQLAAEALRRGHRVTVVRGPCDEPIPSAARVIDVEQGRDMERAMRQQAGRADVVFMASAVSDFRLRRPASVKLRRRARVTLRLEATPDIVGRLPRRRRQVVTGFALETHDVVRRARRKLDAKRLDLLLALRADRTGAPFGRRAVRTWLVAHDGTVTNLGVRSKPRLARGLLDKTEALWYGRGT